MRVFCLYELNSEPCQAQLRDKKLGQFFVYSFEESKEYSEYARDFGDIRRSL